MPRGQYRRTKHMQPTTETRMPFTPLPEEAMKQDEGAPPAASKTDTPEFRKAVADAAAEAFANMRVQLLAELARMREEAGPETTHTSGPADQSWMQALAMSIADISHQGTGRKPVAPQVIKAREEARETMFQRIADARSKGLVPTYELRNKIYIDEQLIEPMFTTADHIARPTVIDYPGVPNEAMKPVNQPAQGIYDAFMASIGTSEKVIDDSPLYVTTGGVVVHGRPPARRSNGPAEAQSVGNGQIDGGLRVKHRDAPGQFVETNILGTIANPARQTA